MPGKMWGGRFSADTDALVERLNNSLAFDQRLWPYDVAGSIAHATMLGEQGIIPAEDSTAIVSGLEQIRADFESGACSFDPAAEDVHTAVELMLRERLGDVAGKLHTARSRNDQVATDTRLFLRDAIDSIATALRSFQETLIRLADQELGEGETGRLGEGETSDLLSQSPNLPFSPTVLPGYTHLQHAQPILLSHHFLAYFWMFQRDRERLADCRKRVNLLPLGSGALAGTSFPINRKRVAKLLEFDGVCENSLDAVSDRDFAIEFLAAAALIMVHCSRLAEELILWNSREFGFVELDDSVTTGSSIMPQKKNPDVAELARGKSGRIFGDLIAVLTLMKALPLAYNKDMQEDKEPLFDAVDTLHLVLPAMEKTLATATFRRDRMRACLHEDFSTATDLADYLVRRGLPFRAAHEVIGKVVRDCEAKGTPLEEVDQGTLASYSPLFESGSGECATTEASIASRDARGGTAVEAVRRQLVIAREAMGVP